MSRSIRELEIECRLKVLKLMNEAVKNCGDEEVWFSWIAVGIPDGSDEEDLKEIAEDYEDYMDIVCEFAKISEFL